MYVSTKLNCYKDDAIKRFELFKYVRGRNFEERRVREEIATTVNECTE